MVLFLFFYFCCYEGERASSRYRSTSPVRRTDRVFDCGKRWVRVDGRVCGIVYASYHCTAREELSVWSGVWLSGW